MENRKFNYSGFNVWCSWDYYLTINRCFFLSNGTRDNFCLSFFSSSLVSGQCVDVLLTVRQIAKLLHYKHPTSVIVKTKEYTERKNSMSQWNVDFRERQRGGKNIYRQRHKQERWGNNHNQLERLTRERERQFEKGRVKSWVKKRRRRPSEVSESVTLTAIGGSFLPDGRFLSSLSPLCVLFALNDS